MVFRGEQDQPVVIGSAIEHIKPAVAEYTVHDIGQQIRSVIVGAATGAIPQVLHPDRKGVGAVPLGQHIAPEALVARSRTDVLGGRAGYENVVRGIAEESVGPLAANQHVAAGAAGEIVVAVPADQQAATAAGNEPVVPGIAIEPGDVVDRDNDLKLVVTVAAGDDNPAAGLGDDPDDIVDRHVKRGGGRAGPYDDRIVR